MNRSEYAKILLCICLLTFVLIKVRAAQSNSAQISTMDVGRDNPFAAIPRNEKITPQRITQTPIVEQEELPALFLETVTLRFLGAKNLEGVIKSMSSRYGSLATDQNTNSLIVCDTRDYLDRILIEIKKIDRRPRQIMVEVVILDVKLNDETEIGINWDILSDKTYDIGYRQNFTTSRIGSTIENSANIGNATAFNTTGLGGEFSVISGTVRNIIHMIQEKRDTEIIASPRAMVVSGQTANIRAVEEIPYTEVSDTAEGGSMTSTEFKNVGISLQVTATITDGNDIFLIVDTEQNVKTGESSGVPVVDTRKANTSLLLEDGQIVIIGGLRRQEKTIEVDQIPFLGDLPFIGRLFRSTNTEINNSELIVLLSPHIYKGESIPEKAMEKYHELKSRPALSLPGNSKSEERLQKDDD